MQPNGCFVGRETNNAYPNFLAEQCCNWFSQQGITNPKIVQLGLAFKENVPDVRNSKAFDLANTLRNIDPTLAVIDPIADLAHMKPDFRFNANIDGERFDAIVLAVPHQKFIQDGWQLINALTNNNQSTLVMDIKARLDRHSKPQAINLWRLSEKTQPTPAYINNQDFWRIDSPNSFITIFVALVVRLINLAISDLAPMLCY